MFVFNYIFNSIIDNDTIQVIRFNPSPTYDEVMKSNNQFNCEIESFQSQTLSNINKQELSIGQVLNCYI